MQNDNCEKGVGIWNVEKATNNPFLLNGCDFGLEKKWMKHQKLEPEEPKLPPILFLKNWKNNSNVFKNK